MVSTSVFRWKSYEFLSVGSLGTYAGPEYESSSTKGPKIIGISSYPLHPMTEMETIFETR
jgi:hypothetical protein